MMVNKISEETIQGTIAGLLVFAFFFLLIFLIFLSQKREIENEIREKESNNKVVIEAFQNGYVQKVVDGKIIWTKENLER